MYIKRSIHDKNMIKAHTFPQLFKDLSIVPKEKLISMRAVYIEECPLHIVLIQISKGVIKSLYFQQEQQPIEV